MTSLILGLALAVVAAVLALLYLWLIRRAETENSAGLRALAGLRWREFSTLVAQAMQRRGLRDVGRDLADEQQRGDGGSQMLMSDGSQRWLLSCKHGMAYRIQASHIDELAAEMDLAGAASGMLLTEGRADRDALAAAAQRGVEIIDSRRLWALLKPFMPADTTRRITADATAQAKRHSLIAVLASLVLGLLVAVLLPQLRAGGENAPAAAPAATQAPPTPAAVTSPPPAPPAVADGNAATGAIEGDPDDATLARYQAVIARTLSAAPGIDRAYWLTRATLVIDRTGGEDVVWPQVCAELDRYPPLRTVRVQLNPRPGSDEAVRWRQCRTM